MSTYNKTPLALVFAVIFVGVLVVGFCAALLVKDGNRHESELKRADKLHEDYMRRIR